MKKSIKIIFLAAIMFMSANILLAQAPIGSPIKGCSPNGGGVKVGPKNGPPYIALHCPTCVQQVQNFPPVYIHSCGNQPGQSGACPVCIEISLNPCCPGNCCPVGKDKIYVIKLVSTGEIWQTDTYDIIEDGEGTTIEFLPIVL